MIGIEKESTFLSFVAKLTQNLPFRAEDITKVARPFLRLGLNLASILNALHIRIRQVENTVIRLFNMNPDAAVNFQTLSISNF